MLSNTHGQTVGVVVWIDEEIARRPRDYDESAWII
jgi:hypothetical protein